jgi:hypothetical protein
MGIISPLQKQINDLQEKADILDKIVAVAKTDGGRITDNGKNLYFILRQAGMTKSSIAKILDVTPAALSKYSE